MDPHVSCLIRPVTEYSATQGSRNFSDGHLSGMDTTRLLFALKQGPRSVENHIREFLAIAHYYDFADIILIEIFCDGIRDTTIIDFVGTIIVWEIITVSRLLWLCIYSFHNIKIHKHSLDIKVLFIVAFWNRNSTVFMSIKYWLCQYFPFENNKWKLITNVFGVFILYILSTFILDLRYWNWKDGETNTYE